MKRVDKKVQVLEYSGRRSALRSLWTGSFVNKGFVDNVFGDKELVDGEFVNKGIVDEVFNEVFDEVFGGVFVEVFIVKEFFHKGFAAMDCFNKEVGGAEFFDGGIKVDWMRVEQ